MVGTQSINQPKGGASPLFFCYFCYTCLNSLAAANGHLLAAKSFKHFCWWTTPPEAFGLFKHTSCFIKFLLAGKNSYPV
jgi:hypothetical protein